jgi:hypothetical protein
MTILTLILVWIVISCVLAPVLGGMLSRNHHAYTKDAETMADDPLIRGAEELTASLSQSVSPPVAASRGRSRGALAGESGHRVRRWARR